MLTPAPGEALSDLQRLPPGVSFLPGGKGVRRQQLCVCFLEEARHLGPEPHPITSFKYSHPPWASLVAQLIKNPPGNTEDLGWASPGLGRPPERKGYLL